MNRPELFGRFLPVVLSLVLALYPCRLPAQTATDTVSMDFRQAYALDVLKIIAQRSGLNLMIGGKAARHPVTVRFTDAPVEEALGGVASAAGLVRQQIGSIHVFCEPETLQGVSPVSCQPPSPPLPPTSISMDFRDVDIRDLLRLVGMKTGHTIIPQKAVRGTLSCRVTNADGGEVAQAAAVAAGCDFARDGDALLIADPGHLEEMRFFSGGSSTSSAAMGTASTSPAETNVASTGPATTGTSTANAVSTGVASTSIASASAATPPAALPDTASATVAPAGTPSAGGEAAKPDQGTATLDLAMVDLDLRLAMNLAALACGRDFLATPEVRGNITLSFRGLSENHLMKLLARSQGFDAALFGNLWVLASPLRMAELASPPVWPPAIAPASLPHQLGASATLSPGDWEPLINLEFRDAAVRDILTLSARRGNKPLRFPPSLADRLSIRVAGAPVAEAIRLICRVCRLSLSEDRTGLTIDDPQGGTGHLTIEPDICPTCPRHPSDPPKDISDSERVAAEISIGSGKSPSGGAIRVLAVARGRTGAYALAIAGGALKTLEPGTELFDRQIVNRIATDSVEFVDKRSRATFKVRLGE